MTKEFTLLCYRGACNNAAHPLGYNRITHGLYCLECAEMLNKNELPWGPLCPLVVFQSQAKMDGGCYQDGLIRIRSPEKTT